MLLYMPIDMLLEIFIHLDIEMLCKLMRTCKYTYNIISNESKIWGSLYTKLFDGDSIKIKQLPGINTKCYRANCVRKYRMLLNWMEFIYESIPHIHDHRYVNHTPNAETCIISAVNMSIWGKQY